MNIKERKTVFFTIEIKDREYIPKMLLAHELALRGYRVYMGTFGAVDHAVRKAKASIFFHKSTYVAKSEFYKSIGSVFVFLDEEGGVTIPRSRLFDFCSKRYGVVSREKNDIVFLPGDGYEKIVSELSNMKGVKTFVTGWPRIDLWQQKYDCLYQDELASIEKKHARYYLFVTSFGVTSKQTFEQRIKSSTTDFQVSYRTHKYHSFLSYVELIKMLSSKMTEDEQIIVRPHPSESIKDWQRILGGLDKVTVIRKGDITPWLLKADAVLQYGSTIAVQAAMSGIPTIQYKIESVDGITDTPVFELSYTANSAEEVCILLRKVRGKRIDSLKNKAIQILKNDMNFDPCYSSSKKIADRLDELEINPIEGIKFDLGEKVKFFSRHIAELVRHYRFKVQHSSTTKRTRLEKIPGGINTKEATSLLHRISTIEGAKSTPSVSAVCRDLICIETK